MAIRAFFLMLALAPLAAQTTSSFQDLAQPLAARIAAAATPGDQLTLTMAAADDDDRAALLPVEAEIRRALLARGVRIVEDGGNATGLRVGCANNLQERACIAEFRRGDAREAVVVTRPLDAGGDRPVPLPVELIPIFSQHAPILDVALSGQQLFVLDPERITLYDRDAMAREPAAGPTSAERAASTEHWKPRRSAVISRSRPWPRDVRGRLQPGAETVTAWLPGVTCRGSVDLSRFACADERGVAWPIGIENTGIDAARNYFYTPEGLPFYAAAPLGAEADARWIVAAATGALLFVDDLRRTVAAGAPADDLAALDASCATGVHVMIASRAVENRRDVLRVCRVVRRRLIPVSAPIDVPGRLTALWSAPGAAGATAIAHDEIRDRYDAFQIRIGCPGFDN